MTVESPRSLSLSFVDFFDLSVSEVFSAFGTRIGCWQPGHEIFLPAYFGLAFIVFLQCLHLKRIRSSGISCPRHFGWKSRYPW